MNMLDGVVNIYGTVAWCHECRLDFENLKQWQSLKPANSNIKQMVVLNNGN